MRKLLAGLSVGFAGLAASAASFARPYGLTVEYLTNPVGIACERPRLSWKIPDGEQKHYEIDAGVWKTGKIGSSKSVNVEWYGPALATGQRVTWKVRVWNARGEASDWSEPAEFTMGVMERDFGAKWIGPNGSTRRDEDMAGAKWITGGKDAKGVVRLVREFDLAELPKDAFAELVHAASLPHEIDINGRSCSKVLGHVWDARFVRFRDVTKWLKKGRNTIEVRVMGEGGFIAKLSVKSPERAKDALLTDAAWSQGDGTPAVATGGVRDTEFGKTLVLRRETLSPCFEKRFAVKKGLKEATLFITGLGFYEASLNGAKVGDKVLDPSPTDYTKRVLYSTYRIEDLLKPGENELRVLLGHGWYDMRSVGSWNFEMAPWRDFPRMIARLDLAYGDGTRERVVSGDTWRQVVGPILYDDLMEGEVYERVERRSAVNLAAEEVPAPAGRLEPERQPGAKVVRELAPSAVKDFGSGVYVVQFAENFAGWVRLTLDGQQPGDVVSIRYDERVNADLSPARDSVNDGYEQIKRVDVRACRPGDETRRIDCHFSYTASQQFCAKDAGFQTDRWICSGGCETYEPRFSYKGFQYVVLRGLRRPPKSVVGCVVQTGFADVGTFESSDPTLNALVAMAKRAYKANFADGVPTDCPHREKNGWTGDASIASELAQYLFENTAGYEKWLNDLCDTQVPSGDICCIVPTSGWGFKWGNGPGWDSALSVIPWNLYVYRDDRRVLDAVYPSLVRYLGFTATKADSQGLVDHGLGDWIAVNRKHMPTREMTSSCYYYQAQRIAAEIAALKGLEPAAAAYRAGAEKTRRAINAKYYKGEGVYDNAGQTAQGMAVCFGLADEPERGKVAARLVKAVEKTDCHVDMGLFGTKHVFRALSRIGRTDLAYRMLVNPTAPSMAEWVQKGGTTLWEDWGDGASRKHIMFGDFAGWAYQYLAGIRLPETADSCSAIPIVSERGFRRVVFEPCVIDALGFVKATVDTPYGVYRSSWRRVNGKVEYEFEVPPGGSAVIRLPGRPDEHIGPGECRR